MASTLNADVLVETPSLEPFADAKKRAGAAAAITASAATTLIEEVGDQLQSDLPTGDVSCQDIAQFFEGRYIFITGATGFVGKVSSCSECVRSRLRERQRCRFCILQSTSVAMRRGSYCRLWACC